MSENKENKSKSIKEVMEKIHTKFKKMDKRKLFGRILAVVLAFLMILSIAATCIYAIISMIG